MSGDTSDNFGNPDDISADSDQVDAIAYLDGELSDTELACLERRLLLEPELRRKVTSLDLTWQMLDVLEDVSASDHFVRRTIDSMTAISTMTEVKDRDSDGGSGDGTALRRGDAQHLTTSLRRNQAAQLAICFAVSFVLAGMGIVAGQAYANASRDASSAIMLENMDLLRRFHVYSVVPDADFLRMLSLPKTQDATHGDPL